MTKEYYQSFWDIVKDWRHYDSRAKFKDCSPKFEHIIRIRFYYLTNVLRDLLGFATPKEIDIFKGYYGVLKHELDDSTREICRNDLEKSLRKFNKIVLRNKITLADKMCY